MFRTPVRTLLLVVGLVLMLATGLSATVSAAPALQAEDVSEQGVLIVSVRADSPAAKAGLVRGDIVLAVDGETVNDAAALAAAITGMEMGDEVALTVLHGDDTLELTAILGEREGRTYLGVQPYTEMEAPATAQQAAPEPEDDAAQAHAESEDTAADDAATPEEDEDDLNDLMSAGMMGALVRSVVEESPAADAGLNEGDLIVAVDGEALLPETDLATVIGAYAPGDEVVLTVRSADAMEEEVKAVTVTLGAHPENAEKAYLGIAYMPVPARMGRFENLPMPPRMPLTPPTMDDGDADGNGADAQPDRQRERRQDGDCDCDCDHEHGRGYHGRHGGMMLPFFGMDGFDLDQLSPEDLEKLQEMMPFLFPDQEEEAPERDGGL